MPFALPPEPEIDTRRLEELESQALLEIGRLDAITGFLPEKQVFLYSYVRKEAVLSSQIEGTQSSLSDLLLYENEGAPGVPMDDVEEVSSYVAALEYGLAEIRQGMPIHLRLIREIHRVLMSTGRGHSRMPGEFRHAQNWIGATRPSNAVFVPPPPHELVSCLADFERFVNEYRMQGLRKSALAHVQFETIHPFLDGNGRLGRLLISFILAKEGLLGEPLLYLSLYFKRNRTEYYELLNKVRLSGDWETWLEFYNRGVIESARSAVSTAQRLLAVFESDRQTLNHFGRTVGTALRIQDILKRKVMVGLNQVSTELGISKTTASQALQRLQDEGVVHEVTGRPRYQLFAYTRYLQILNEDTES